MLAWVRVRDGKELLREQRTLRAREHESTSCGSVLAEVRRNPSPDQALRDRTHKMLIYRPEKGAPAYMARLDRLERRLRWRLQVASGWRPSKLRSERRRYYRGASWT